MCFSATASFTSGAILAAAGLFALSRTQSESERPFAAIPLIFAVQQAAEGCLWLGLGGGQHPILVHLSTYVFLFFAQILWPLWIPFAILCVEIDQRRRHIMLALCVLGAALSVYMTACLVLYGAQAEIIGHHISYQCDFPAQLSVISGIIYGLATILPVFISSRRHMWILGTAIAASYAFTDFFYGFYTTSVWCYCAAMLSTIVVWILAGMHHPVAGRGVPVVEM
jgi:hypothetical protein